MGTSAGSRRGRAGWRVLASFVSFLLLFGFALGQGGSWIALAEGERTPPVAAEEPADEAAAEEAPGAEEAAEEPAAEEASAEEDGAAEGAAPSAEPGGTVDADAPAAPDVGGGSGDDARSLEGSTDGSTGSEAVEPTAQEPDTPGAPSGDGIQPVLLTGNQNCTDVFAGSLLFEHRHEPVSDATIDLADESDGDVQGTLTIDVRGSVFDFSIAGGDPVSAVGVKGGTNANLFDYRPGGSLADTNLHPPVNPQNDRFYGLSHISFCWVDEPPVPSIDVEKTCEATVPLGEDITYMITVRNAGNEDLEDLEVTDALLGGDITGEFTFPDPFSPGDEVSERFTHSPGAGEVENSVTATGDGVESGDTVDDTDVCTTTVEQPNPSIGVSKSCDGVAHVGDTITYTIIVTNTGDEDLTGITVDDSVLGPLSAAFVDDLAAGASDTQQFQHVVSAGDADPIVNVVSVAGSGVESETPVEGVARCQTDILNPAIDIVKTVDEELIPIGTTVTYTYLVTNTGDTTLYDVSVDDDVLGHIGDIPSLEPGDSAELTADFVVGDEIVTNVAIAEGEDILGRSVSADDDAVVTPIAGETVTPPNPREPPFTGSEAGRLGLISLVLFGVGATVVAATRRRRPGEAG
jgi:uncharacterized repeat protein (TIGR01451 family)